MYSARRPAAPPSRRVAAWTLAVLTLFNFLNYVDRYVLAAVLDLVRRDAVFAGLSEARLGLLQTAFLVVYMVVSPLAGLAGRRLPRKYLVAFGVGLWSAATFASGLVRSYPEMLVARALIGFGEAGYATVAPAMLGDLFAKSARARVLSLFYLATPVGSALGFVLGGAVAAQAGWRAAFFLTGGPGLAAALLVLFIREPERGAQESSPRVPFGEAIRALAGAVYLRVTAGTALMTFTVGGLAFWMPTYFQAVRHMPVDTANLAFGSIAVVAGIVGTFAGGFLGDRWNRTDPRAYLKLSAIGLALAAPLTALAPFGPTLPVTFGLVFLAELFIFLNTGPLNTALLNSLPPEVRELGIGLHVLAIHLFGDAISPPLIGAASDALAGAGLRRELGASLAIAATALPLLVGALVLWQRIRRPSDKKASPD